MDKNIGHQRSQPRRPKRTISVRKGLSSGILVTQSCQTPTIITKPCAFFVAGSQHHTLQPKSRQIHPESIAPYASNPQLKLRPSTVASEIPNMVSSFLESRSSRQSQTLAGGSFSRADRRVCQHTHSQNVPLQPTSSASFSTQRGE